MTILRFSLLILIMTTLAGCAGKNFDRPQENFLQLGETTENEVIAALGDPKTIEEDEIRGMKVKDLNYSYAIYPFVRHATYNFMDEVLVGYVYSSNFPEDSTDFDLTKVGNIVENKSTRQNVESALGEPSGEFMYPYIEDPEGQGIWYFFFSSTVIKNASFELDKDNVVRHIGVDFEQRK